VEPAVRVTNLPPDVKPKDLRPIFHELEPLSMRLSGSGNNVFAVITLRNMKDVEFASTSMSRKVVGDKHIVVEPYEMMDTGFELQFDGVSVTSEEITTLVRDVTSNLKCSVKDVVVASNVKALLCFEGIHQAVKAQSSFQTGAISLSADATAGTVVSRISVVPAFTCEVTGFSPDMSVKTLDDALIAEGLIGLRKYERKAMLKFKRHMHVLPGIIALKKLNLDGVALQPEKYQPLVGEMPSEYDTPSDVDGFDQFSLKSVLKDYLHADPATRYLIAKNRFERALFDAKVLFTFLLFAICSILTEM
jgi:hypothetical protein